MSLEINLKSVGDATVVNCVGSLDTQSSLEAEDQLNQLIDAGATKIVVNFETLDFVSSAGLRVLLAAAKSLKKVDGELRICGLNEIVKEVFDISGFATIFKVFGSESEALDGF